MAEELDCVSNAALATIKHLMKERDALRVDASRYRKLEAWFLSPHSDENFFENMPDGEEPATPERFRAAVDALPELNDATTKPLSEHELHGIEVRRVAARIREKSKVTQRPRGTDGFGSTDALPEREDLPCPECDKCKRHAYSDATTPGFFYDRCEKHRRTCVVKIMTSDDLWAINYTLEHWKPETPREVDLLDIALKLLEHILKGKG